MQNFYQCKNSCLYFRHQLEINLLEEKQKEEKRLIEIKLAQALQRSSMLESQLNSYRKIKNQLVEQIHAMMQKQWQEALAIISSNLSETLCVKVNHYYYRGPRKVLKSSRMQEVRDSIMNVISSAQE